MAPETVGFIGLGLMGKPMATNLLKKQYSLIVHSRSRPPVDTLIALGARDAASPAAVARDATIVITMLPDTPDVERVLTGDNGVLSTLRPGSVVIDMSSIAPDAAKALASMVAAKGASMLDAPVSGGDIGARNATLSIMVGGDRATFDRVKPILDAMGQPERVIHIGSSGAGQICKICNQIAIGGALAGVSEALALARKAGVDPTRVRTALLGGFAASRVLEVHGERILTGNFTPGFRAALYKKDLGIAKHTAASLGVPISATAVVAGWLDALVASGNGELDYAAIGSVVMRLAGLGEETRS